jgi:hypothetical protein
MCHPFFALASDFFNLLAPTPTGIMIFDSQKKVTLPKCQMPPSQGGFFLFFPKTPSHNAPEMHHAAGSKAPFDGGQSSTPFQKLPLMTG